VGIPLDIFSLYGFEGEGCRHRLLLRVGRPEFSNADEGDYARAVEAADRQRDALRALFEAEVLAGECAARHTASLEGELQSSPAGDELSEGRGGRHVELWVAETRFGRPWVVLGTAASEEEFWRAVEQDEDLSRLGARRPAKRRRAYFLTEEGDLTRQSS
jgi:hypothetical protein